MCYTWHWLQNALDCYGSFHGKINFCITSLSPPEDAFFLFKWSRHENLGRELMTLVTFIIAYSVPNITVLVTVTAQNYKRFFSVQFSSTNIYWSSYIPQMRLSSRVTKIAKYSLLSKYSSTKRGKRSLKRISTWARRTNDPQSTGTSLLFKINTHSSIQIDISVL